VPFDAVPENVIFPANEELLTVPLTCPFQFTDVEFQFPLTSDPDCVSTIVSCSSGLLDETTVPFHVPAMLVAAEPDASDGETELPPHAETHATTQTSSAMRIAPPCDDVSKIVMTSRKSPGNRS